MDIELFLQPYVSPCGTLYLGCLPQALVLCDWKHSPHFESHLRNVALSLKGGWIEKNHPLLRRAGLVLDAYFHGDRPDMGLPLLPLGTHFQRLVWNVLQTIPYGQTRTYKELAAMLGKPKAARAVARANALNPLSLFIPCHRVIGQGGCLTGYAGGLSAKRYLLELEKTTAT